jgi:hypothetical protein
MSLPMMKTRIDDPTRTGIETSTRRAAYAIMLASRAKFSETPQQLGSTIARRPSFSAN